MLDQSQTVRVEKRTIPHNTEIHRRDLDFKYILGCDSGETN